MTTVLRRKLLRWIVLATIAAVLLAIGYDMYVSRAENGPIPSVRAVIVYYKDAGLAAYDCYKGAGYRIRLPLKFGAQKLLGYSSAHRAWAAVYTDNAAAFLAVIKPGHSRVICSGDRSLYSAALRNDVLYVPKHAQGRVSLKRYTLDGKPIDRVRLSIDNVATRFAIAVAPDGLIAASFTKRGRPEAPRIYLFGDDGRLRKCLGTGSDPRFGNGGSLLAYRQVETMRDLPGYRGTGRIIIDDLKRNRRRIVDPSKSGLFARRGHPGSRAFDYQLSPDGRSLVCSHAQVFLVRSATRRVHVADLSNDTPRWYKLPIQVRAWVVLDRVPESFTASRGNEDDALTPQQ